MTLFFIMLTSTVYLQLRQESYNSVTFALQLLSRIATFHQHSYHFILLYCRSLDTSITTDQYLLSTT